MPRFFFHLATPGELMIDNEGIELADLEAAKELALASAQDIAEETAAEGYDISKYIFKVTDDQGRQVMQCAFKDLLHDDGS